jgi:hypothetical protein
MQIKKPKGVKSKKKTGKIKKWRKMARDVEAKNKLAYKKALIYVYIYIC